MTGQKGKPFRVLTNSILLAGSAALLFLSLTSPSRLFAQKGGEEMAFIMKSTVFNEGERIPGKFTCDGSDVSPPLSWEGAPSAVRSFTLIMDDPDAPVGTFNHWILYDIPSDTSGLPEGVSRDPLLPDHSKQGVTSFHRAGYGGPCPPKGPAHRYFFTLYALDMATLGLEPKASKKEVENKMKGHIIGKSVIMGRYGR